MKKRISLLLLIYSVLLFILSACNMNTNEEIRLTEEQVDELMIQYVENMEYSCAEYLPSIWIASSQIFGIEYASENIAYIYAYVLDEEYVNFKDKAYVQSSGCGPVKIKVELQGDNIKYLGKEKPEDGEAYQDKLKEMFPKKYYSMCEKYNPYEENGELKLKVHQKEQIKEMWGIDISEEYSLHIEEDGRFELVQINCGGMQGELSFEVIESGRLERY